MARRPLWIWPNILSLDAPLVALAWFWMFKQIWLVKYHQPSLPWLLALTVWCIYVADRLMDSRGLKGSEATLALRHRFHCDYRGLMTIALCAGVVGVFFLLLRQSRGLLVYAYPVAIPVLLYFLISFGRPAGGICWFKNVVAGLAFAYGTAVGVHFRSGSSVGVHELALSPEVVIFALLCMINMMVIDYWESGSEEKENAERDEREIENMIIRILLLALVIACYLLAGSAEGFGSQGHKAFYLAAMVGAGGLAFLSLFRQFFSPVSLRILADVALLLPLPFFCLFAY
tara:strand:- start:1627 stop:2487 length:861 start_codon:yes stop_codon:yes gene_type:complete